jgi:hypothetical protein
MVAAGLFWSDMIMSLGAVEKHRFTASGCLNSGKTPLTMRAPDPQRAGYHEYL